MTESRARVLFCCTGVGIYNRGIESFFREAFNNLCDLPEIEARLVKGAGVPLPGERVALCLPRTAALAARLGRLARRNAYVVEQWSSFPSVVAEIRRFRPHVIFYSDANLGFLLFWFRRYIGVPFRLLFSNGGPVDPPYIRTDFVHQVTPLYHDEAIAAGEPKAKHFLVPYGIRIPPPPEPLSNDEQQALRRRLGLPIDRPTILSVGWISRQHKRMDYIVEEVAALQEARPFLIMLGAMDDSSEDIIALATERLGPDGFASRSVPYEEVADYYRAADCFVLASLKEGFGRVYLEALMHGLPVIAHRHPVMEYVLGGEGILLDLSQPGALAPWLTRHGAGQTDHALATRRWHSVANRFAWDALRPAYGAMFAIVASAPIPGQPATPVSTAATVPSGGLRTAQKLPLAQDSSA